MPASHTLTPDDRQFLELVCRAIFVNPFSDERAEVDALIIGDASQCGAASNERVLLLVPRVSERIGKLESEGKASIEGYIGSDRRLVAYTHLFDLYHRLIPSFDALIQTQIELGPTPADVPFAKDALESLARRGFAQEESLRHFSLFYQLRRAFYFIERSLVGRSPSMKNLRRALWNNVFTHDLQLYNDHLWDRMEDFSTLLLGETGTGKGTAAAAIGRSGYIPFDPRAQTFKASFTRTFVAINLSQYPESLIESELFGHKKGAFTGAVSDHEGMFSQCSRHGALFLDEIGDVSIPVQIKLLQVLEERTFSPVGSHERLRFEGRVIAATNRPIHAVRRQGGFRDDFFYRLCSDIIELPTLRERLAEYPAELEDLLAAATTRLVGEDASELLPILIGAVRSDLPKNYAWPGNVRELEQAVRRILVAGSYTGDQAGAPGAGRSALADRVQEGDLTAGELLAAYCAMLYDRHGTYGEVARRTGLDRRTAKKHVDAGKDRSD